LAPGAVFDVAAGGPMPSGGLAGAITPAAGIDSVDQVEAVQALDAGGTTARFVVREAAGAVVSGAESYGMTLLPVGSYSLSVTRRTLVAGVETVTTGAARSAAVTTGVTTAVSLTVP
jgi:hypothetical protein